MATASLVESIHLILRRDDSATRGHANITSGYNGMSIFTSLAGMISYVSAMGVATLHSRSACGP